MNSLIKDIYFRFLNLFGVMGKFVTFCFIVLYNSLSKPFYINIFFNQIFRMGFASLFLVAITSFFSGGVLALHSYASIGESYTKKIVPEIVALSIIQELGPVLIGLLITGRVASSITAEIATMRVTEQIDALFILSTNPIKYLVVTRILAGAFILPFLVLIGNIIGIIGGMFVAEVKFNINHLEYITSTKNAIRDLDVYYSLIKALVFSFIITFVSCFNGFYTKNGAQGVGRATINSVVISSVLILISNYSITFLLLI